MRAMKLAISLKKHRMAIAMISSAFLLGMVLSGPALAQAHAHEGDSGGPASGLFLELNALQQVDAACRMVFMAQNTLSSDLTGVSFETVLVNTDGVVDRLTVFDFKDLPKDRTRVRQFDLDNTQCETIGRVLINGAASCEGNGITGSDCIDRLSVSSRTDVEISG